MYPIRIMDRNFTLIGETAKYTTFIHEDDYYGIGLCEMHINFNSPGAEKIQINHILFPTNEIDKAFIISHKELSLSSDGKQSEILVVRGYQLKSILKQRIIIPQSGKAYNYINSNTESAMHHFVETEAINPVINKRKISNLELGTNMNRGTNRRLQGRYDVLSDKIGSIGVLDGLGWTVSLDLSNKKFVFNVLQGVDRTIEQNINKRAIFSAQLGTLNNFEYIESFLDYSNYAIIAGQGEGADRITAEIDTNQSGLDLYETFIDARDISDKDEDGNDRPFNEVREDLLDRGRSKMDELSQSSFASGETIQRDNNRYGVDYNLGDLVTINNTKWGVQLNARITKVRTVIEYGRRIVEHTFDNDRPTLVSKIKNDIDNIKNEVYR